MLKTTGCGFAAATMGHALFALILGAAPAAASGEPARLDHAGEAAGTDPAVEAIDPGKAGSGLLLRKTDQGLVPLPMLEMKVDLGVAGIMIRGEVTQSFRNPTAQVIEAIYVFPLPERAAVDGMEIRIGERRIRGVIQEKEAAKAGYEAAKSEGRKTALVDQRQANLFSTSVANINPGEEVSVSLRYVEEAAFRDGELGLVFPLTYTPRYLPAGLAGRSPVGDAGGCFLPEGSPQAPRATIEVRLEAGEAIEEIRSPSHPLRSLTEGPLVRVSPEGNPVPADRDFVLRWRPRRDRRPAGTIFVEDREDARYGLLMLLPPAAAGGAVAGLPTETLFVIDVSGSMEGPSIEQARQALMKAIDRLRPGDTFDIIKFNHQNEVFSDHFVAAGGPDLDRARAWVDALTASGGTEIPAALHRGLQMLAQADPWPAQRLVLITDGAVGDEEQIFSEVGALLGRARLHIVGIGSAPNRSLLRRLAEMGRGAWEFIGNADEVEAGMSSLLSRIDRPVMADLTLRVEGPGSVQGLEIYPQRLPDLYAGEPLFVSFRAASGASPLRFALTGRMAEGPQRVDLAIASEVEPGAGIATRWARARVDDLLEELRQGRAEESTIRPRVIEVARRFDLVTRFTSMLAVEEFPSSSGAPETHRLASSLPHGSTLLDGALPQGGTPGPLLTLVGLGLLSLGALLAAVHRLIG